MISYIFAVKWKQSLMGFDSILIEDILSGVTAPFEGFIEM